MDTTTAINNDDDIQRYQAYAEADPDNALIWNSLGDIYHQVGRFNEAIDSYKKSLALNENNNVAWSKLANVLISQQEFAEAEKILTKLVKHAADNPNLLHNLGLTLYYQQRWPKALPIFEQARAAGINSSRNDAYIVYCLHHMDDTEAALKQADIWLQQAPGPETEGYIAMLEMDHGNDPQAAYQRAESVLQIQPNNTDASAVMGTYMVERQEIDRAIGYFKHIADSEPDNLRGWQGLGMAYLYQQNFPQAIANFDKALALNPGNEVVYLLIGWAHLANKDAKKSEDCFRKALKSDRNYGEAHGGLATALIFQNRQDEAQVEIKRAIKLDPEGFGAIFANSVKLKLQGKGNMAQKMLGRLLERAPRADGKPLIDYIQAFARQQAPKKELALDDKPGKEPQ